MTLQEIKEIVACEKLNLFSLIDESLIQNDFMKNLIIFDNSNLIFVVKGIKE